MSKYKPKNTFTEIITEIIIDLFGILKGKYCVRQTLNISHRSGCPHLLFVGYQMKSNAAELV